MNISQNKYFGIMQHWWHTLNWLQHSIRWFTLVELVVVITILAILWTVALLAFRWYSWDARNSKRITDLHNIKARIIEQITNNQNMLNFVTSVAENRLNTTPSIGGATPSNGTNYEAGTINYPTIGMIAEDFSDPSTNTSYVGWVTTVYKGGAYQVTAKMDPIDDAFNRAYILGTYKPRHNTAATTGYVSAFGILGAGPVTTGNKIFTITSGSNVWVFKVWDTVIADGASPAFTSPTTRTISKISADGLTLTFSTAITTATTAVTSIALNGLENRGIIDENNPTAIANAANTDVIHDGSTYLPY
jgi:prepilin-type N-terminal cleavage/methylation domain-containing protein